MLQVSLIRASFLFNVGLHELLFDTRALESIIVPELSVVSRAFRSTIPMKKAAESTSGTIIASDR